MLVWFSDQPSHSQVKDSVVATFVLQGDDPVIGRLNGFIVAQALAVEFHILEFRMYVKEWYCQFGIGWWIVFHKGFVKEDTIDNFRTSRDRVPRGDIERPADVSVGMGEVCLKASTLAGRVT